MDREELGGHVILLSSLLLRRSQAGRKGIFLSVSNTNLGYEMKEGKNCSTFCTATNTVKTAKGTDVFLDWYPRLPYVLNRNSNSNNI